jgi:hypothetical protein
LLVGARPLLAQVGSSIDARVDTLLGGMRLEERSVR